MTMSFLGVRIHIDARRLVGAGEVSPADSIEIID